jgi:hypothetical protein
METPGKTVYSFMTSLEVSNFPLRTRSAAEVRELARVTTLRKIEIAEARIAKELISQHHNRASISFPPQSFAGMMM